MLNSASWVYAFSLSFCVFRLGPNQSLTVCIECANQNVGLSIAILLLTLSEQADEAVGVPMFMGTLNAVIILIFGTMFRISGFIEDNDDATKSTKYADSGFTKMSQCCTKRDDSDNLEFEEGDLQQTLSHRRYVPSASSMDEYDSADEIIEITDVTWVQTQPLKESATDDIGEPIDTAD